MIGELFALVTWYAITKSGSDALAQCVSWSILKGKDLWSKKKRVEAGFHPLEVMVEVSRISYPTAAK